MRGVVQDMSGVAPAGIGGGANYVRAAGTAKRLGDWR